ncbi:hypothetical protein [Acidianus sp. RZ1]|uniref:hypothetical protein n=1 Tax=Acidianus sp. RZ1 TaxID=1540082 RepID=UPI0014914669|nr:hypothetical protein [Acidianus sp. RZ1]NON63231.1 hypothetical protein [Acidianus sp. RZ1]
MISLLLPIFLSLITHSFVLFHSPLVYNVQVIDNGTIYTYTYNFTVISKGNSWIDFNLTISSIVTYQTLQYNVSSSDPYPLPVNFNAFNISNLHYIGNITENGKMFVKYYGIFSIWGKYKVPVTAIFYTNGTLYSVSGKSNGLSITISPEDQVIHTSSAVPSTSIGYNVIIIIFVIALLLGIILLLKMGKL